VSHISRTISAEGVRDGLLRKLSGHKRDDLTGEWTNPHNYELHDWYSSPLVIRAIKSKRVKMAEHVTCVAEERNGHAV
jgi:hypothetical protein